MINAFVKSYDSIIDITHKYYCSVLLLFLFYFLFFKYKCENHEVKFLPKV